MRIPLEFIHGEPTLWAAVIPAHLRAGTCIINFVIDTGCQISFISWQDVQRFNLQTQGLSHCQHVGIAGHSFELRNIPGCSMSFAGDGDEPLRLKEVKELKVALFHGKGKQRDTASTIPSLLGLDFLARNRLNLFIDAEEELAYLQTKE